MRYSLAILVALVGGILTMPGAFAGQGESAPTASAGDTNDGNPLSPVQIVQEFMHLPLGTQKDLMKILMSQSSEQEKQESTDQLDSLYATLPPDVQQSLYQKWNALSDEQRIALKHMDPSMMKALLSSAFHAEVAAIVPDTRPIKAAIEKSADWAEKGRAYVQKLLYHRPANETAQQ